MKTHNDNKKISAFKLYNQLKTKGLKLSPGDYKYLMDAVFNEVLKLVYPEDNYNNAIIKLCKSLWVKSVDEEDIFNEFDLTMDDILQSEDTSKEETNHNNDLKKYSIISVHEKVEYAYRDPEGNEEPLDKKVFQINDSSELYEKPPNDLGNMYFPASTEEIKLCFKNIEQPGQSISKKTLNIDATIRKMIQNGGKLIDILYSQKLTQKAKYKTFYLLIDQSRSMRPFNIYTKRLINAAKLTQLISKNNDLYFENVPEKWLCTDEEMMNYQKTGRILQNDSYAIIVSDAGYARGRLNENRIELTKMFNKQLKEKKIKAIWLNPLPRSHWFAIGFKQVHHFVPMYDMSVDNLKQAVNYLNTT